MRRREFIAGLGVAGVWPLPSNLNAQQVTLKEQLVGTWTIISWEGIDPNGAKRQIENPRGFLMFDAGGRYAQVIARTDRPKFKSPGQPTAEELAAATEDFFAGNAGTWRVSEAEKLFHRGASTALHAAVILSVEALTNLPPGFSTAVWEILPFTAY